MGTGSQLENSFSSQGFFGSLVQYGCQVPLKAEIELKRDEWTMMEVEKVRQPLGRGGKEAKSLCKSASMAMGFHLVYLFIQLFVPIMTGWE